MGFTVPLRILLICLLHFCAAGKLDPKIIMNTMKILEKQLGGHGQYAVALSVQKDICLRNSGYAGEEWGAVKNAFEKNEVYVGTNIIAAKPKQWDRFTEHSEFRIQNYLKDILNKKERCVIYFTVNSPCMTKCLLNGGSFTIENSLKWLEEEENGAFVFKKMWRDDQEKPEEVVKRLKEIAPKLPYYQCSKECVKLLKK